MTKREQRVIQAFINIVRVGEESYSYAVKEMENDKDYGYLTDEAKEMFYAEFEAVADQ